jgi:hypothetical protein
MKVLIALPAHGGNNRCETTQSLCAVVQLLTSQGVNSQLRWMSIADITDARNLFLTTWYDLARDFTHLLFVDADMHFAPALVWDMLQFGKPLTGAFYSKRDTTGSVVGQSFPDESADQIEKGFLKVKRIGGGVMLIRRGVVDAIVAKFPEVIDTTANHPVTKAIHRAGGKRVIRAFDKMNTEEGGVISEDFSFCDRWRACDGEIWANVNHPIGHVGNFEFALRYQDYLESRAEKQTEAA